MLVEKLGGEGVSGMFVFLHIDTMILMEAAALHHHHTHTQASCRCSYSRAAGRPAWEWEEAGLGKRQ
jgi:hypothetical protein